MTPAPAGQECRRHRADSGTHHPGDDVATESGSLQHIEAAQRVAEITGRAAASSAWSASRPSASRSATRRSARQCSAMVIADIHPCPVPGRPRKLVLQTGVESTERVQQTDVVGQGSNPSWNVGNRLDMFVTARGLRAQPLRQSRGCPEPQLALLTPATSPPGFPDPTARREPFARRPAIGDLPPTITVRVRSDTFCDLGTSRNATAEGS